jgi:hypothetical protein
MSIAWLICRRFSTFCSRVSRLARSGAAVSCAAGAVAGGVVAADGAADRSHPTFIAATATMHVAIANFSDRMFLPVERHPVPSRPGSAAPVKINAPPHF